MEVGDAAAWFAAGVAIIAAVIAMSNANSAKTQAGAALKQAAEAQKAREAAEAQVLEARNAVKAAEAQVEIAKAGVEQAQRSAAAAEQQVAIMREQLAAAEAERNERDTPQLTYDLQNTAGQVCGLVITLDSGPSTLDIEVLRLGVRRAAEGNVGTPIESPRTGQIHKITPGGSFTVDINVRGWSEPMTAQLDLRCTEPKTKRHWDLSRTVNIPGPSRNGRVTFEC
ncbi:hypothetical protein [Lentzea sp. NPDC060358]|uniref:hypothetical protein n=1 Tax=Lentzea sp. NPDC060358 TaxID=3347103 RepID=UPI00365CFF9A